MIATNFRFRTLGPGIMQHKLHAPARLRAPQFIRGAPDPYAIYPNPSNFLRKGSLPWLSATLPVLKPTPGRVAGASAKCRLAPIIIGGAATNLSVGIGMRTTGTRSPRAAAMP